MRGLFRFVGVICISVFLSNPAYAVLLYITDVDSQTAYIINTDTGAFTTYDTGPVDSPGAIAVTDRIVLTDWQGDGGAEYDLSFNATGTVYSGDPSFSEMLDGTTDGAGTNYAVSWSGLGVIVFDGNFENGSVLFNPPFNPIGITFDPSNNSLWLANDDDGTVHNYTLGGSFLSSFDPGLSGRTCCLAYNPADDTIWMGENDENTLYQYSKAGVQLDSVTPAGWSPSNNFGAEIQRGSSSPSFSPVPGLSQSGLAILALLILVGGWVGFRRFV